MAEMPLLISVDVESTGDDFERHALVELGAAAYAFKSGRYECLEAWSSIMQVPSARGWGARCVRQFWSSKPALVEKKRSIEATDISPVTAMSEFVDWVEQVVKKYAGDSPSPVRFITDNAAFDAAWIGIYLCKYGGHNPLHTFFGGKFQAVIDTSSYHQGVARIDHVEERKRKRAAGHFSEDRACRKFLRVPDDVRSKIPHDHDPKHDAQNIAEEHAIILHYMKKKE
jgi:hypothetical protein